MGLKYLHEELEPPIVHRDIKTSNILLDRNFVPKIGDFGVAKLFPDNITHISTRVAGTTYDIKIHLDMQTWNLFEEGRLAEVVDPALKEYPEDQVIRYIKVALFCTQAAAGRRPSVLQVVDMLSKPVQLKDEEITPPGYMEDRGKNSRGLRATNSTYPRSKDSTSSDTTTPFTSGHVTFTEMSPR
ncbi:hypothetical protein GW17_00050572 [Ensete ventricosum]|nr:hypothetical protein GW17_00050572 [Ensete ventricosum]